MVENFKIVISYPFTSSELEIVRAAAGEKSVIAYITQAEELSSHLRDAEVLCSYTIPPEWREQAPHLRWFQSAGAGVDGLRSTGILDADTDREVVVTTAVGIHAYPIGEYVLGSMLLFNRRWPKMVRMQDQHVWPRSPHWYRLEGRELTGQTLGIVGLGSIGRRIAQLGKAFEMRVLATKRTIVEGAQESYVDQLYPMKRLREMLAECDHVVLAVPLTPETEKLIGEPELRAMRPNAYLVNIARGRVIDEKALIRALEENWIGGAGLDVTEEEPLPSESPLYSFPNVILTPHIAGVSNHYGRRLAELFADNLRRYRAGESLRNRYEATRGY